MISETLTHLKETKHLVILTGAGISAESGIPTFQDKTELSETFNPKTLGSAKDFSRNPKKAWGWYEWRRHKALRAEPNAGHEIIAKLATTLPKVTLMTQNVDNLHERAGSQNVLHLHGSIHKARCFHCYHGYQHPETTEFLEQPEEIEPPKCEQCGDWIRPSVVWFGENLSQKVLREAEQAVKECDLMLIVGTSGLVYPVANLPKLAIERNITTIQVNLTETDLDTEVTFDLKGKAGEILSELYKMAFLG